MWLEVVTLAKRKRAVGYVRVSTEEQAREGLSLAAQESRIKAYCEAKGWELVRVYRDEGYSGKDLRRPGIQALIRDLKADGIDVVVVLKLDRLTRSVRDLGALIEDLFGGVALASVEESLDSSTANGRMVINLLGTVAESVDLAGNHFFANAGFAGYYYRTLSCSNSPYHFKNGIKGG